MKVFNSGFVASICVAAAAVCVSSVNAEKVAVSDLVVSVTDGPLSTTSSQLTASYPAKVSNGKVIAANASQYIHVVYNVVSEEGAEPLTVSQSVVCFRHKTSQHEAYFPSKANKNGKHIVSISTANEKAFEYKSGEYEVLLFVADASVSNPISWQFATIAVQVPEDAGPPQLPIYTVSLTHETDTSTGPLKVINHMFRAPDARAPLAMSVAFSAALVAAFVGLVVAFPMVGGSLKALSTSLSQILFLMTLLAILALYALFWVSLDLITTLTVLTPAGILLVVFGRAALAAHEKSSKFSAAKASKSE